MMREHLLFEFRKLIKRKVLLLLPLIMIIVTIGVVKYYEKNQEEYLTWYQDTLKYETQQFNTDAANLNVIIRDLELIAEEPEVKPLLEDYKYQQKLYYDQALHAQNISTNFNDDTLRTQSEIKHFQNMQEISDREWGNFDLLLFKNQSITDLENDIFVKERALEKGISIRETPYDTSSSSMLLTMTGFPYNFLVIIPLLWLAMGAITSDFDQEAYKFIYVDKASRIKIFTSKILFQVIVSIIVFFLYLCIVLLTTNIMSGLGEFRYPILRGEHVLETMDYLKYLLWFGVLSTIIMTVFSGLLSFILKTQSRTMSVLVLFVAIYIVFRQMGLPLIYSENNPLMIFDPRLSFIITGAKAICLYSLILIGLTVLLFFVTANFFRKEDLTL